MNGLFSGLVDYSASAGLGLPDAYGTFVLVAGAALLALAGILLPDGASREAGAAFEDIM